MNVVILGSSGIIGQHMQLYQPPWASASYYRRDAGIAECKYADVVVNLAGIASVDYCESHEAESLALNFEFAYALAQFCEDRDKRLVHVSSNAAVDPVNVYGRHKKWAELVVALFGCQIVRPSFVLGFRPDRQRGRVNPLEDWVERGPIARREVGGVMFAASLAPAVARRIWQIVRDDGYAGLQNVGTGTWDRWSLARLVYKAMGWDLALIERVGQEEFAGTHCRRPCDTTGPYKYFPDLAPKLVQMIEHHVGPQ